MGHWTSYKKTCEMCGQSFTARRHDTRYCGATCRKAASRLPGKIERLAEQAQQHIQQLARQAEQHPDLAARVFDKLQALGETALEAAYSQPNPTAVPPHRA